MRCFFHLVSSHASIRDEEGIEVADLQALCTQVAKAVVDVQSTEPPPDGNWDGWQLEVTDTSETVLVMINIGAFSA
jgi:hypothetical protein